MVQPSRDVPTAVPEDASAEPSDDATAEVTQAQGSESAEEPENQQGAEGGSVALATDFDPCTVLSADEVSAAVGYDWPWPGPTGPSKWVSRAVGARAS